MPIGKITKVVAGDFNEEYNKTPFKVTIDGNTYTAWDDRVGKLEGKLVEFEITNGGKNIKGVKQTAAPAGGSSTTSGSAKASGGGNYQKKAAPDEYVRISSMAVAYGKDVVVALVTSGKIADLKEALTASKEAGNAFLKQIIAGAVAVKKVAEGKSEPEKKPTPAPDPDDDFPTED